MDVDLDEVFDVFVEVSQGDNAGLATYNIAFTGLDASPLDPSTFVWTEGTLSNLGTDFVTRGFTAGLLESAVGTDGYSAANSQFQQNAIFGVGQTPVFEAAANPGPPGNADIDLGVPAFLGTLAIPGANGLSDAEFAALLAPNAAVFVVEGDSSQVVVPDVVTASVASWPEPGSAVLFGLAVLGLATTRGAGLSRSR